MLEPTTADIKSLLNTEKIKDGDNELLDDINDFINDDLYKNKDEKDDKDDEDDENISEDENELKLEDNDVKPVKEVNVNTAQINPNDFKEMLDNGEFESLTPQQQRITKYDLLMKLANLVKENGIQVTTDYNMDSDYYDIKREYDYHVRVRSKKRAVATIYSGVICVSKALEFLNNKFDPFGVNINGFTLNLEASREEMLDVLTELYEKYFGLQSGEISPEMQFLLIIIKALLLTMVTNYASSYMSSLFDKSALDKERLKQQFKQNNPPQKLNQQFPQQQFQRSENVMEEFNKEVDLRNVKLSPIPEGLD